MSQVGDILGEPEPRKPNVFNINPEVRHSGQWVIAPQGKGKTNYLLYDILERVKHPGSVVVMDPKGELPKILRELRLPKETVVVDPVMNFALNPLDMGTHSQHLLTYVFGALCEAEMTSMQATLFGRVTDFCIKHVKGASLSTFEDFIIDGPEKYTDLIKAADERTQRFFFKEYSGYTKTRVELQWRLQALLSTELTRSIFLAPVTKFRLDEHINDDKVVIINNANTEELLGDVGSEFFGRFFIALIRNAALKRQNNPDRYKPCYVYIDECDTIIRNDQNVASIIDKCRTAKIALTLSHQRMKQIREPNVLDALANCAIRVTNADEDASHLAPRFRSKPEELRLPIGCFRVFVGRPEEHVTTLRIPDMRPVLSSYPKLSKEETDARSKAFKDKYTYQAPKVEPPADQPPATWEPGV